MPESVPARSRLISRIVAPALQLWLRSQVDHVETLQVKVEGGDRQILSGHVLQVSVWAQKAIYQGLHLSQVALVGKKIRLNLGQILKGQPLQLLEPIPVAVTLLLQEADLNASLPAPLLANALSEFLVSLLGEELSLDTFDSSEQQALAPAAPGAKETAPGIHLQDPQIAIAADQLTLSTTLVTASGHTSVILRAGLRQISDHELQLEHPQWLPSPTAKRGLPLTDLEGYILDLGPEVAITHLSLAPGQLTCQGRIMVQP